MWTYFASAPCWLILRILLPVCRFCGTVAAGTPLLTADGWKPIEAFTADDLVLSRDDGDLTAPLEARPVEELFVRMARILRLTVRGIEIQTTGEHPFFVLGHAWLPANELQAGDFLATHDGEWARVDAVDAIETWGTVYNLRVHEDHTYFVGKEEWGFAVWAHNSYEALSQQADAWFTDPLTGMSKPVLTRHQTSGILASALRLGNGDAVGTARRIAQSFEARGLTMSASDQRVARLVEAGMEGHFSPNEIAHASFLLRAEAIHSAYLAKVSSGAATPIGPIPSPVDFSNSVFPSYPQHHVFEGHLNGSGTGGKGLHSLAGTGRLGPGPISIVRPPDALGVYEAYVEIFNPHTGSFVPKVNNHGLSTLFPDSWTRGQVLAEIYGGFLSRVPNPGLAPNGWIGQGPVGVLVQGYFNSTAPGGVAAPFGYVPSAFPRR